jgi:CRISPR-associated protein Cas1
VRDAPLDDSVGRAIRQLATSAASVRSASDLDGLRGIEGDASRAYFSVFQHLVSREGFQFGGRSRRPPRDNVNAALSFVYTLLMHDARAALEAAGLDSQVGFLHRDRPGRPSLALDLMEEFRGFLADRLVLSLINRGQVSSSGFQLTPVGGVVMDDATRKCVIASYQKRKLEELTHPFLAERITIGHLIYVQALLLARYLRGDIDAYPPFLWR